MFQKSTLFHAWFFSGDREVVKRLVEPLFTHRESAPVHADAALDAGSLYISTASRNRENRKRRFRRNEKLSQAAYQER
jgi:hypothetical protein